MNDKKENQTAEIAAVKAKDNYFKKLFSNTKFKHGGASVIMTAVFIAIVIFINILATALSDRFPSLDIDMTAQKINTLSEDAVKIAKSVQIDTEILLLVKEDEADKILNVGNLKYSQVPNLAKKMQEANPKIKVRFVDLDTNPQFVQEYPDQNLSKGYVIIKSEKRTKVLSPMVDLFSASQNQQTGATEYVSKVDSALANAVSLVNVDKVPKMSVATGHDELLVAGYRSAFDQNLKDHGFETAEFNIMTEEIPENTNVVMIPTPSKDYTEAEITKLREFLADETADSSRSILYIAEPTQAKLPLLESFLEEWGVQIQKAIVAETDNNNILPGGDASTIFVQSTSELFSKNSYSYLVSPISAPIKLLFAGNDSISTSSLWTSYDSTYVVENENSDSTKKSAQTVASMSSKMIKKNGEYVNENVIVFTSPSAFTSDFINSSTFGNKQFFTDLFSEITGADVSQVYIPPVQVNQLDIAASSSLVNILGLGVFTVLIPLAIIVIGLIIFLRRRHL